MFNLIIFVFTRIPTTFHLEYIKCSFFYSIYKHECRPKALIVVKIFVKCLSADTYSREGSPFKIRSVEILEKISEYCQCTYLEISYWDKKRTC